MFNRLRQQLACLNGNHHGGNFCAFCGKQLVNAPFNPFQVRSTDGTFNKKVLAVNANHAKLTCGSGLPLARLIAERLPVEAHKEQLTWQQNER